MLVNLSLHHYCEVTALELLNGTELKLKDTLIFCDDLHRDCSADRHTITKSWVRATWIGYLHYFKDATKRYGAWIIILLLVFTLAIFDESESIIAYNKATQHTGIHIIAFSPDIVTEVDFLTGLE